MPSSRYHGSRDSDSNYDDEIINENTPQSFEDGNDSQIDGDDSDPGVETSDLTTQINELFRHIYNEEQESVDKLKKIVFPQIEGMNIDSYIVNAIDSSMNIVRDQLRTSIKDTLCNTVNKNKIHDLKLFDINSDNYKSFLEVVQTVIDFYKLFQKSTPAIIEVWSSKLTHVHNLKETLELQHKYKFFQKIWKDEQIFAVLKAFTSTSIPHQEDQ